MIWTFCQGNEREIDSWFGNEFGVRGAFEEIGKHWCFEKEGLFLLCGFEKGNNWIKKVIKFNSETKLG